MYVKKDYPDVLYLVKPSEDNEELKYSLRSLKNLNHGKVFIAGYKPSWVNDRRVEYIPVDQDAEKYQNVRKNLAAAIADPRLGDDFVLMNDDFFIMEPMKSIPTLRRRKDIDHYIELYKKINPESYYVTTMQNTRDFLQSLGIEKIHSYELHTPMLLNKQKLHDLFKLFPKDKHVHLKTTYGNYYAVGGSPVSDVKVINDDQDISYGSQFISTIDESFKTGKIGEVLRKKFAKVLVFSHANDADGLMGVVLAQLAFAEVDYLLTNTPQTDILRYIGSKDVASEYDYVIITDIYPGRPVLEKLPNVYWFDHKQHSLDKIHEHGLVLPNAVVKVDIEGRPTSGSELFYRWLVENTLLPEVLTDTIEYVRKLDTWDF